MFHVEPARLSRRARNLLEVTTTCRWSAFGDNNQLRTEHQDWPGTGRAAKVHPMMAASAIWRWSVLHLARQPLVLLLWGVSFLWMPLVQRLEPIPSLGSPQVETALAWCFPVGLLGVLLGLVTLSQHEEFLQRLDPLLRWAGDLGATLAPCLLLQLPIAAGALAGGTPVSEFVPRVPAILCTDLRLAGLALLMLLPGISTAARVLGFLGLAWLVPAFLAGGAPLAGRVAQLLDASDSLRCSEPLVCAASALPGAAFVVAAYLLRALRTRATDA